MNPIRPKKQDQIRLDDDPFYTEITRLNNQLANIQRTLTKKTFDLERKTDELEQKSKQLEELNKLKNEMMGMAAHDLRSPLSTIMSLSELLLENAKDIGALNEHQHELVYEIHQSSDFMLKLINEMLNLSQIESGNVGLKHSLVDLDKMLSRSIRLHNMMAREKDITLVFHNLLHKSDTISRGISQKTAQASSDKSTGVNPESGNATIHADQNKLEQVINNLLGNAIKFSPEFTEITVTLEQCSAIGNLPDGHKYEPGDLLLHIKDQGRGIAPEDQKKLFKPFTRIKSQSGKNEKSTGLGLAITQKLVTAHGWSIHVESEIGQGSVFTIHIPENA